MDTNKHIQLTLMKEVIQSPYQSLKIEHTLSRNNYKKSM